MLTDRNKVRGKLKCIVQSLCRYKQIQELCLKKQFQYNNPRHAGSDGIIETWESNISNIYYVRMVYFNAVSFLAHSHDQKRRLLAHLYKCSENHFTIHTSFLARIAPQGSICKYSYPTFVTSIIHISKYPFISKYFNSGYLKLLVSKKNKKKTMIIIIIILGQKIKFKMSVVCDVFRPWNIESWQQSRPRADGAQETCRSTKLISI